MERQAMATAVAAPSISSQPANAAPARRAIAREALERGGYAPTVNADGSITYRLVRPAPAFVWLTLMSGPEVAVNPRHVQTVAAVPNHGTAGERVTTIAFVNGEVMCVQESLAEVVARLGDASGVTV